MSCEPVIKGYQPGAGGAGPGGGTSAPSYCPSGACHPCWLAHVASPIGERLLRVWDVR